MGVLKILQKINGTTPKKKGGLTTKNKLEFLIVFKLNIIDRVLLNKKDTSDKIFFKAPGAFGIYTYVEIVFQSPFLMEKKLFLYFG